MAGTRLCGVQQELLSGAQGGVVAQVDARPRKSVHGDIVNAGATVHRYLNDVIAGPHGDRGRPGSGAP